MCWKSKQYSGLYIREIASPSKCGNLLLQRMYRMSSSSAQLLDVIRPSWVWVYKGDRSKTEYLKKEYFLLISINFLHFLLTVMKLFTPFTKRAHGFFSSFGLSSVPTDLRNSFTGREKTRLAGQWFRRDYCHVTKRWSVYWHRHSTSFLQLFCNFYTGILFLSGFTHTLYKKWTHVYIRGCITQWRESVKQEELDRTTKMPRTGNPLIPLIP